MLTPAGLHRIYQNNTDTFLKSAGSFLAAETDRFLRGAVVGLWARGSGVTDRQVAAINELYSKNQPKPKYLYWELTRAVCEKALPSVPDFFTALVRTDALRGSTDSRTFIRITSNVLLTLAADDEDVSMDEAQYITSLIDALQSVCDNSGVKAAKKPLPATEYVTSPEPSFLKGAQKAAPETAKAAEPEKKEEAKPEKTLEELMAELDELVGLDKIKTEVKSLVNLIKVRKLRVENGLKVPPISLHMVFMGNPGTGKTTVARMLAGIYRAMGVLSKGQLVEVDRSGLVAGYVGQTAIKTAEAVEKAQGGILFIDEAYSLTPGDSAGNDYGREAVEIILKAMEDKRDDFVVVAAGYENLMERFIASNPGLESRFSKYFMFEDYNGGQLFAIFESMCKKNQYELSAEASAEAKDGFARLYETRDDNFGNARDVRNIFERAVQNQSDRVAAIDAPTKEQLLTLEKSDLPVM